MSIWRLAARCSPFSPASTSPNKIAYGFCGWMRHLWQASSFTGRPSSDHVILCCVACDTRPARKLLTHGGHAIIHGHVDGELNCFWLMQVHQMGIQWVNVTSWQWWLISKLQHQGRQVWLHEDNYATWVSVGINMKSWQRIMLCMSVQICVFVCMYRNCSRTVHYLIIIKHA